MSNDRPPAPLAPAAAASPLRRTSSSPSFGSPLVRQPSMAEMTRRQSNIVLEGMQKLGLLDRKRSTVVSTSEDRDALQKALSPSGSDFAPAMDPRYSREEAWSHLILAGVLLSTLVNHYVPRVTLGSIKLSNIRCKPMRRFMARFRVCLAFWKIIQDRRRCVETIRQVVIGLPLARRIVLNSRVYLKRIRKAKGLLLTAALSRRHTRARVIYSMNQLEHRELYDRKLIGLVHTERRHPFVFSHRSVFELEPRTLEVRQRFKQDTEVQERARASYELLLTQGSKQKGGTVSAQSASAVRERKKGVRLPSEAVADEQLATSAAFCYSEDATEYEKPTPNTLLWQFKAQVIEETLRKAREKRYAAWRGYSVQLTEYKREVNKVKRLIGAQKVVLRTPFADGQVKGKGAAKAGRPRERGHVVSSQLQRRTSNSMMGKIGDVTIDVDQAVARIPRPPRTETLDVLLFPPQSEVKQLLEDARALQAEFVERLDQQRRKRLLATFDGDKSSKEAALTEKEIEGIATAEWQDEVRKSHTAEHEFAMTRCRVHAERWGTRTIVHRRVTWEEMMKQRDTANEQARQRRSPSPQRQARSRSPSVSPQRASSFHSLQRKQSTQRSTISGAGDLSLLGVENDAAASTDLLRELVGPVSGFDTPRSLTHREQMFAEKEEIIAKGGEYQLSPHQALMPPIEEEKITEFERVEQMIKALTGDGKSSVLSSAERYVPMNAFSSHVVDLLFSNKKLAKQEHSDMQLLIMASPSAQHREGNTSGTEHDTDASSSSSDDEDVTVKDPRKGFVGKYRRSVRGYSPPKKPPVPPTKKPSKRKPTKKQREKLAHEAHVETLKEDLINLDDPYDRWKLDVHWRRKASERAHLELEQIKAEEEAAARKRKKKRRSVSASASRPLGR